MGKRTVLLALSVVLLTAAHAESPITEKDKHNLPRSFAGKCKKGCYVLTEQQLQDALRLAVMRAERDALRRCLNPSTAQVRPALL